MFFISLLLCAETGTLQAYAGDVFKSGSAIATSITGWYVAVETGKNENGDLSVAILTEVIQPLTVSVLIASSQDGNTCAGSPVTFTASVINGGTNPSFQWKINGVNAGENSVVFASSTLKNGDKISCTVTSNLPLVSNPIANSNVIIASIGSFVIPHISIAASPGNSICVNTPVTFTAKVVDAAAAPFYQWKLNGNYTGTNSDTFTSNSIADGDVVSCDLTNLSCNMTTLSRSNNITMTVSEGVMPAISITASETNVCKGVSVSFSATSQHAGNSPSYQWKINGTVAGNNQTYSSANLSDKDVVQCLLLPEQTGCAGTAGIISNAINITILPSPDFVITPGQPVISKGDSIQLSASGTNIVSYEWSPAQYISNTAIGNPTVWPDRSQTYMLKATSGNSCSTSKEVVVTVVSDIFIPTAFTPNNDGLNDVWKINGIELYPGCRVSVFDRSGNIVFRSAGYGIPWNGIYKGEKLSSATFVYLINLRSDKKPLYGTVTIIR